MPDATTTNRGYPYPNGKDFIPNGPAEMEAIVNALDEENRGEIDYLQAGVTLSTDWNFTAALESTSECKLESLAAIGLVRSVTTAAKIKALKPASLPGNGKYMTVGFELTPSTSDGPAMASVVAGVEEGTLKAAEEHVPATTAGKLRIRNIVVLNTAGVYSIAAQTDVRPWCTGGTTARTKEEGRISGAWEPGDLKLSAATNLPAGWLKCEGQEISRTTYAALFAAIGTGSGEGNKTTTFNVPDFRGRIPMGAGTGTGGEEAEAFPNRTLGQKVGALLHKLTVGQLAKHGHVIADPGHRHRVNEGAGTGFIFLEPSAGPSGFGPGSQEFSDVAEDNPAKTDITLEESGLGEAHNIVQPSTVCNVWIKT
jgi:microcystin-dependent protein